MPPNVPSRRLRRFRIDTEVPLRTDDSVVFPDLSVCTEEHRLQLLVEVKVDSEFHDFAYDEDRLSQPDYYAAMWERHDPRPARVRRVGTLTRRGEAPRSHELRCGDISWPAVAGILRSHAGDERVGAVAVDLASFIEDLSAPGPLGPEAERFLERWRPLLVAGAADAADRLGAARPPRRPNPGRQHPFLGTFLKVDVNGAAVNLWMHLSPARTLYAVLGFPDGFYVVVEESSGKVAADALPAIATSFEHNVDGRGFWRYRRFVATEKLEAVPDDNRLALLLDTFAAPIGGEDAAQAPGVAN